MKEKVIKLGRRPSDDPKEVVRVWVRRSVINTLGKGLCQDVAEVAINEEFKKTANGTGRNKTTKG